MNTTVTTLTIKNWAKEDQPILKIQQSGSNSLTDAELLATIIGCGSKGRSAVDVARLLLSKFNNSLSAIGKARLDELTSVEGIGLTTACKIAAAIEIGKRREKTVETPELSTATRIYNYMIPFMKDLDHEESYVLLMNQNFHLIRHFMVGQGGITETSADIRIVMREAVLSNATIIAFVHNHPSGSIHPSRCDDNLTMSLKKASEFMRIHFADHVIVTDGSYYSYRECGKI